MRISKGNIRERISGSMFLLSIIKGEQINSLTHIPEYILQLERGRGRGANVNGRMNARVIGSIATRADREKERKERKKLKK